MFVLQVESQDMLRDMRGLETIMEIEQLLLIPLFATILPHQVETLNPQPANLNAKLYTLNLVQQIRKPSI